MAIKSVIDALNKYDNFLITSHVDPEPDALGSELSMYELLKKLGKKSEIINSEPVPEQYGFMQGIETINYDWDKDKKFDAAIVVDCPTLDRTGNVKKLLKGIKFIINIDHHISNEKFGDVNLVNPDASSAAEIVYGLFKEMSVDISQKVASYIYVAILTDTGSFTYSNTSSFTHEIVSDLIRQGISPHTISNHIYESKKYEDLKLLGKVLSTLKITRKGRVAYLVCTNEMIKKTGASMESTQDFINFARSVKGVVVSIIFKESEKQKNRFKVSMRSKDDISVNKIAAAFGGGGHKYAAGCIVDGALKEVKKKVLKRVSEEFKSCGL